MASFDCPEGIIQRYYNMSLGFTSARRGICATVMLGPTAVLMQNMVYGLGNHIYDAGIQGLSLSNCEKFQNIALKSGMAWSLAFDRDTVLLLLASIFVLSFVISLK